VAGHIPAGGEKLERALGPVALTFYGIGAIVGAGIYSVIGEAAGIAGKPLWVAFVLAAIAAGLTALSYCELSTWRPQAGAEFHYVREAVPRAHWISFTVGALVALTGATTSATVAIAFGGYVREFVEVPAWAAAVTLLVACTALNVAGIRESTRAMMVLTSIETLGLVLVIGAALLAGADLTAPLSVKPEHATILPAAALCFFVYTGFEGLANIAEESHKPERDLPIAFLASLAITTILYILVALSVVSLVEPKDLAAKEAPLSFAIGKASPSLSSLIGAIALIATASTALITLVVGARVVFGMARAHELPRIFARTSANRSPWLAAMVLLAVALALVPLGKIAVIANVSSMVTLATFVAINLALIVLRYRRPRDKRPFRTPLNVGRCPVTPILAILISFVLMTQFEVEAYVVSAILVAVVTAAYLAWRKLRQPATRA
jgi:APA family basic amino acid/polyamine antiporter